MERATGYVVMVPLLGLLTVIQSVLGPRLAVLGIAPDLVLIAVILVTLVQGPKVGLVWAFVGGIWLDVVGGGPFGGSSLALMAASLVTGIGHHRLFFQNPLVPLAAGLSGGLIYGLVTLALLWIWQDPRPVNVMVERLVLPAAIYDTAIMLLLTPVLWRFAETRRTAA